MNIDTVTIEISKLSLKKDDILVIRVPHQIPRDYYKHIRANLKPIHDKTLILTNYYDIGVIEKDAELNEFESLFILD